MTGGAGMNRMPVKIARMTFAALKDAVKSDATVTNSGVTVATNPQRTVGPHIMTGRATAQVMDFTDTYKRTVAGRSGMTVAAVNGVRGGGSIDNYRTAMVMAVIIEIAAMTGGTILTACGADSTASESTGPGIMTGQTARGVMGLACTSIWYGSRIMT